MRVVQSYPEHFFEQLLEANGISFKREVRIGKWFCDFVIGQFVLEIDGRQHADRRDQDAEKDNFVTGAGFSVTRIQWKNPKSKTGLADLMNAFETFKRKIF